MLDRIDIHVEAPPVEYDELTSTTPAEFSSSVRRLQAERFDGSLRPALNARMQPRHMREAIQYRTLDRSLWM